MYEDRILAFIDVLGFSDSIKKSMDNGLENEVETKKINSLIESVQFSLENINYSLKNKECDLINNKIVNQFSDTIIISYLKNDESEIFLLLLDILNICYTALSTGFLLRGAIVLDKVYHTDKKIFGPALVKAYKIEKTMAIYPRIILDDSITKILDTYNSKKCYSNELLKYSKKCLIKDFDGLYFINYFTSDYLNNWKESQRHQNRLKQIIEKLESIDDESVKLKLLWLKNKYSIFYK